MANVAKKENLTISIREYQDNQGQTKKVWKTIGELITWDDGKQSFEMWGANWGNQGKRILSRQSESAATAEPAIQPAEPAIQPAER